MESSVETAAYTVRRGGLVLVIGVGRPSFKLPFMHMSLAEIDLQFINRVSSANNGVVSRMANLLVVQGYLACRYLSTQW